MSKKNHFGKNLQRLREKKGWSRDTLAQEYYAQYHAIDGDSISVASLGNWERGKQNPSLPTGIRLAQIFGDEGRILTQ